jgi:glycosyltransferase involved in cell wall biosynthesis
MTTSERPAVAVNALWCVPGHVGGTEEYTARQLLGLADVDAPYQVTAYAPQGWSKAHPDVAARIPVVEAGVDGHNRPRRVLAERTWLRARTRDAALVHHAGGTLAGRPSGPTVLTIHDLQWLTYPEYVSAVKLRYLRLTVPRSARRATVVAVPSEYVRASVVEAYDLDPAKVVVVPHGFESTLGRDATPEAELRARYGLGDGPVLLLPAITHPHKGHVFALEVMAAHWHAPDLRFVLIGGRGLADDTVAATIGRLGLSDRVVRPGRVPAADRDGLVRMASAVVFPTQYEGFGAPVLEAMALGTPVVTSDRACMPEVVGDAGIVLPLDHEAWADVPALVVARRDALVTRGLRRAETFTAARSGEALAAAYRLALS